MVIGLRGNLKAFISITFLDHEINLENDVSQQPVTPAAYICKPFKYLFSFFFVHIRRLIETYRSVIFLSFALFKPFTCETIKSGHWSTIRGSRFLG